jgi:DNA-binding NarL/FixJ family response regulator
LVADDDLPHRQRVRQALEAHGFLVVGEVADAAVAIAVASRQRPDICLIELDLPGGGLHAIGRIAKSSPETLIVVISRSDRPEDVVNAFTRGGSGYLLKGISGERLATTLRAAHRGEPALARSLVPYLVDEIRRGSGRRLALPGGPVTLTPREWEVGDFLCDGLSTAEIAERLGLSPVTVRRHVGLLLQKLGAPSRQAAVDLLRTYRRN